MNKVRAATTIHGDTAAGSRAPGFAAVELTEQPTKSDCGPTENTVHVNEFHATLLHLMGLDHRRLTYYHNGLDERLTGPS